MPALTDLLADAHVVALPMRVRFRGITTREALLLQGPKGWGEFAAFPEYDEAEAANWLAAGIEAAWLGPPQQVRDSVPINATVPAVASETVPEILKRFPGADTAKVKVAEPGRPLADDVARVEAVRAQIPHVRVDANGGWTVDEAVEALDALGPLQYVEQPCRTVEELAQVRRLRPAVKVAADESIRRAEDPLRVARAGALDVAVVKVAPLGGMRATLRLAAELAEYDVDLVVSSALDTVVGIGAGLAAAAALPEPPLACGLATGELFERDVASSRTIRAGTMAPTLVDPDPDLLRILAAPPDRRDWWLDRLRRCYPRAIGRFTSLV
ncbi:MAG TPA: o-succinylbenzoate synthase [Aldersonia sp.]